MPEGATQGLKPCCLPEGVAQNCILLYRRFLTCRLSEALPAIGLLPACESRATKDWVVLR